MTSETIDSAARPVRQTGVRFRRVGGRLVLIVDEDIYELNETAEMAWGLCTGENTLDEIVSRVATEYDAPAEQIRDDLSELFGRLESLGALTVAS